MPRNKNTCGKLSALVASKFVGFTTAGLGSCLAQSYILHKLLKEKQIQSSIVKGWVVFEIYKQYWGHFWVELPDGKVLDPATEAWLASLPVVVRNALKPHRQLFHEIPSRLIKDGFTCRDDDGFEAIRCDSYDQAMRGEFWLDVMMKCGPQTVDLIYEISKSVGLKEVPS